MKTKIFVIVMSVVLLACIVLTAVFFKVDEEIQSLNISTGGGSSSVNNGSSSGSSGSSGSGNVTTEESTEPTKEKVFLFEGAYLLDLEYSGTALDAPVPGVMYYAVVNNVEVGSGVCDSSGNLFVGGDTGGVSYHFDGAYDSSGNVCGGWMVVGGIGADEYVVSVYYYEYFGIDGDLEDRGLYNSFDYGKDRSVSASNEFFQTDYDEDFIGPLPSGSSFTPETIPQFLSVTGDYGIILNSKTTGFMTESIGTMSMPSYTYFSFYYRAYLDDGSLESEFHLIDGANFIIYVYEKENGYSDNLTGTWITCDADGVFGSTQYISSDVRIAIADESKIDFECFRLYCFETLS